MQYLKQLYQLFKPPPTGGLLPGSAARRSAAVRHRRFVLCPWTTYTHSANSTVTLGTDARRPGRTRREDRLSGQVEGVVVLFAVEPLVVQGLKGPFSDAVMARSLDPGADVRN
ncbi:MAG: hypothetical protein ACFN3I_11595 [Arachnia propionica]